MKKTLLFLLTTFTISAATAQGNNLQFNSVLTMSFESTFTTNGQVLKITSAHASHTSTTSYNEEQILGFKEASSSYYTNLTGGIDNSYSMSSNNFPVWLKAGTYNFELNNRQNNGTGTAILTGIYFNIVQ